MAEKYLYRHKKRGTVYEVVTDHAHLQCATAPEVEAQFEGKTFTVYRSARGAGWYIRLTEEFDDGRFETIRESNNSPVT